MLALLKRPFVVHVVTALFVLWALVAQIGSSGVWDPYELDNAELARRIEVHLFEPKAAAHSLAIPSDPPTIPTTSDLGMGELGFTSMALAYRVFGWRDWAGRLAMALWAWGGAMALYVMVLRLVDRRAAVMSALALVTMPLFFMQARTMVCDSVTIAAFSMATAGLALAVYEKRLRWHLPALAVGGAGLVAGYFSRGLLLGVAPPLLGVGAAGMLASRVRVRFQPLAMSLSIVMAAAGIGAAVEWLHLALPLVGKSEPVTRAIGMTLFDPVARDSTFDRILRQLGHALFPWSAFLPFALGRLARAPSDDPDGREAFGRLVLLSCAGTALLATTAVAPYAGAVPYVGVAVLAGAIGVALRDFERGAPSSRTIAIGTLLLGAIFFYDLKREPVRMLETFTMEVTFPTSFEDESARRLKVVAALFVGMTFMAFMDPAKHPPPMEWKESYFDAQRWWRERRGDLSRVGTALADAWNGNLVFVVVVVEAALIGLGAMLLIGTRGHWESIGKVPRNLVELCENLWWEVPLVIAVGAALYILARDGIDLAARVLRSHRATFVAVAGVLAGLLLSFGYYPALARQLSPKEMFETFGRERGPNDELGLLAVSPRAASFYWNGTPHAIDEPRDAFPWLVDAAAGSRRWLVLRARDLPAINASYRAAYHSNLPILDARSSQLLLASSSLGDEPNQNPFDATILSSVPHIQHPLEATFDNAIDALGWDIENQDGKLVTSVLPGQKYTMHFYYRAKSSVGGNWQAFVHVDRPSLRHTADHPVLDGRYPMSLWREGDIIKDSATLELEPSFLPGDYWMFFGFFNSSTRMKVTAGEAREDRVVGGTITVR